MIELLKEEMKELGDDKKRVVEEIDDLIKEVCWVKEGVVEKGECVGKEEGVRKGMGKVV